jgi:hypothetical protein
MPLNSPTGPTADDIETFGQDLAEFSQRAATPIVDQRVGHLEQQISEVRASQQRQQLDANRRLVIDALDREPPVPNWRQVNDDPKFIRWLDKIDPLSGHKLIDMLRRAFDGGDASRVRVFFQSWAASQLPQRQRTQHREAYEGQGQRQPQLTVASAENPRKIWQRSEIDSFYAEVRKGLWDNRESEKIRIEKAFIRASQESRVANPVMREFWSK